MRTEVSSAARATDGCAVSERAETPDIKCVVETWHAMHRTSWPVHQYALGPVTPRDEAWTVMCFCGQGWMF